MVLQMTQWWPETTEIEYCVVGMVVVFQIFDYLLNSNNNKKQTSGYWLLLSVVISSIYK